MLMNRFAWRPAWAGAFVLALLLAAGCGNPRGTVPVVGRVTFGGQPPPQPGYVYFVPRNDDPSCAGRRPGTAIFAKDGAFTANSFEGGDGLVPGTYEVRVTCEMPAGSPAKESHFGAAKNLVPAAFKPADVTVPSDGSRPFRVEIDVR